MVKKAVINVRKCFLYSVLSVLHYDDINTNRNEVCKYQPFMKFVNIEDIKFPFTVGQLQKFHVKNPTIAINLLSWDEKTMKTSIIRGVNMKIGKEIVNVLLVEWKGKS